MPIKYEQLANHLTKPLAAYLVVGDEPLLMMEAQDSIREYLKQQGFGERRVYEVARNFSFDEVTADSDNFSLFAEKKIIELRFDKIPDKQQQKALQDICSASVEDQVLIISCPKLDKRQLSSKWVKAVEQQGLVVQIWPVAGYQLTQWIGQRARQAGIELTPDAQQLLADRCEGNLLAAKQDLDKLALLAEQQPIGPEQVMASVANNARYTTFELIDTALSGNGQKVVRMLRQLQAEGVVPVILVSTLYREARQMVKMSSAVAAGQSVADVVREYRVWSSRSRLISGALQRIPPKVWQGLVKRCAHLDKLSKGMATGNVWDELLTCLLLMGGKPLWKKVI